MRLSAFSVVDGRPAAGPEARDRWAEVVQLAETADRAGLSTLWIAEHHFGSGGRCPSPPLLLAACAMRTRRLRLGTLVSVLPFHEPVGLAEELALVDRLSGGRLEIGVGSGYLPSELSAFGLSPETKRERFDRSLETLRSALAGEAVRLEGSGGSPVVIDPLPLTVPSRRIHIAVQRREAIRHVARRGAALALIPYATVLSRAELGEQIREYRESLPRGTTGHVTVAAHVSIGRDRPRAALARYLEERRATASPHFLEKASRAPAQATPEALETAGLALFGSLDQIQQGLGAFADLGVDEVAGIFDFGGLEFGAVRATVEALGSLVGRAPPSGEEGRAG